MLPWPPRWWPKRPPGKPFWPFWPFCCLAFICRIGMTRCAWSVLPECTAITVTVSPTVMLGVLVVVLLGVALFGVVVFGMAMFGVVFGITMFGAVLFGAVLFGAVPVDGAVYGVAVRRAALPCAGAAFWLGVPWGFIRPSIHPPCPDPCP